MIKAIMGISIVVLMISSVSWAEGRSYERSEEGQEQSQGGGRGPRRHGPPPEAISICEGQSEGASCTFQSPHGELTGTCATVSEGDFACRPANHPHGRRGGEGGQGGMPPPIEDSAQNQGE